MAVPITLNITLNMGDITPMTILINDFTQK
jgi:hypothetical protein